MNNQPLPLPNVTGTFADLDENEIYSDNDDFPSNQQQSTQYYNQFNPTQEQTIMDIPHHHSLPTTLLQTVVSKIPILFSSNSNPFRPNNTLLQPNQQHEYIQHQQQHHNQQQCDDNKQLDELNNMNIITTLHQQQQQQQQQHYQHNRLSNSLTPQYQHHNKKNKDRSNNNGKHQNQSLLSKVKQSSINESSQYNYDDQPYASSTSTSTTPSFSSSLRSELTYNEFITSNEPIQHHHYQHNQSHLNTYTNNNNINELPRRKSKLNHRLNVKPKYSPTSTSTFSKATTLTRLRSRFNNLHFISPIQILSTLFNPITTYFNQTQGYQQQHDNNNNNNNETIEYNISDIDLDDLHINDLDNENISFVNDKNNNQTDTKAQRKCCNCILIDLFYQHGWDFVRIYIALSLLFSILIGFILYVTHSTYYFVSLLSLLPWGIGDYFLRTFRSYDNTIATSSTSSSTTTSTTLDSLDNNPLPLPYDSSTTTTTTTINTNYYFFATNNEMYLFLATISIINNLLEPIRILLVLYFLKVLNNPYQYSKYKQPIYYYIQYLLYIINFRQYNNLIILDDDIDINNNSNDNDHLNIHIEKSLQHQKQSHLHQYYQQQLDDVFETHSNNSSHDINDLDMNMNESLYQSEQQQQRLQQEKRQPQNLNNHDIYDNYIDNQNDLISNEIPTTASHINQLNIVNDPFITTPMIYNINDNITPLNQILSSPKQFSQYQ